jgi:hypothetical protein
MTPSQKQPIKNRKKFSLNSYKTNKKTLKKFSKTIKNIALRKGWSTVKYYFFFKRDGKSTKLIALPIFFFIVHECSIFAVQKYPIWSLLIYYTKKLVFFILPIFYKLFQLTKIRTIINSLWLICATKFCSNHSFI